MDPGYSSIELQDERGDVLLSKAPNKRSREFSLDTPALAPGRYKVKYRMLASDGDFLEGNVEFAVGD